MPGGNQRAGIQVKAELPKPAVQIQGWQRLRPLAPKAFLQGSDLDHDGLSAELQPKGRSSRKGSAPSPYLVPDGARAGMARIRGSCGGMSHPAP